MATAASPMPMAIPTPAADSVSSLPLTSTDDVDGSVWRIAVSEPHICCELVIGTDEAIGALVFVRRRFFGGHC